MTPERDLTNADSLAANRRGFITDEQRAEAARLHVTRAEVNLILLSGLSLAVAGVSYIVSQPAPPAWALVVAELFGGAAVLLAATAVYLIARRRQLIQEDLAAGEVLASDGWVFWRNGPMATFAGQPRGAFREGRGLTVGPYHFHYLPRSGFVLSAEFRPQPLADEAISLEDEPEDTPPPAPIDLPTAMGFTDTDLQYNRDHHFSPAQAAAMRRQFVRKLFSRLGYALVLGIYAWYIFNRSDACKGPIFIFSLVTGVYMFGGLLSDWVVIRDNHVSQLDGEVTREPAPAAEVTPANRTYACDFSGHWFEVTAEAYALLADGERYRVYYVTNRLRPLSLERLPDAVVELDAEPPTNSQVT